MDLESVADELYGLPLEDFVATRNAREKQARAAGDKDLGAAIHGLTKPSAAAWLANQLARHHRDELQPLLELGGSLREAMASLSGPELRALGQQQHRLISALVGQAGALANADGRKVSADTARGLEGTLHAALADPGVADELMAGRLTDTVQRSGFGGSDAAAPKLRLVTPPPPAASRARSSSTPRGPTVDKRRAEQLRAEQRRAERAAKAERKQAEAALAKTVQARDAVARRVDAADTGQREATERIARLRAELDQAVADKSRFEREQRQLKSALAQASRRAAAAQRRLDALA